MSSKSIQLTVVALCLLTGLGVFLLEGQAPPLDKVKKKDSEAVKSFDITAYETDAKNKLDSSSLAELQQLSNSPKDSIGLRKLAEFWVEQNNAGMAAQATEELATVKSDNEILFNAAYRYLAAFRQSSSPAEQTHFIKKAISGFNKVLQLAPENTEAKAYLGVCYVEGAQSTGEAPMKGVSLLKEVLEKDSTNLTAIVNLGYFSIQSGQYDKAIERFKQALRVQPTYLDAYIYMADAYQRLNLIDEAIESLETLKKKNSNKQIEENVNDFIKELRSQKRPS